MLEVKIKKLHKDAVIPKYETVGSVGMDLAAVSKEYDEHGNVVHLGDESFLVQLQINVVQENVYVHLAPLRLKFATTQ